MQTGDGGSEEARAAKRAARVVEAPCYPRVVELPREVVEKLLPLVPACTLLRARTVCRCGPQNARDAGSRRGGGGGGAGARVRGGRGYSGRGGGEGRRRYELCEYARWGQYPYTGLSQRGAAPEGLYTSGPF